MAVARTPRKTPQTSTPKKSVAKPPRGARPASSPKRKLFGDAAERPSSARRQLAAAPPFALRLPDGSAWTSESWPAALKQMELLHSNAKALARSAGARSAAAAMGRVLKQAQAAGSDGAAAQGDVCARFRDCCAAAAGGAKPSTAACPAPVAQAALDAASDVAVTNPRELHKYKPFSREVYGETNASLVQHIIDVQQITADDTFADLGSGIGQVVLQTAAVTGCRALGVELMDTPAHYATALQAAYDAECAAATPRHASPH